MKGLIIDEPWIGLLLRGEKIWEMRKTACHHRGSIGLIRKGSGQVVGVADVVASLDALSTPLAYAEAEPKHRIPPGRQHKTFSDGWRVPWVLSNARPLTRPVPYKHPSGAVVWVNLDDDVRSDVEAQIRLAGKQMLAPKPDTVVLNDHKTQNQPSLLRRLFSRRQAKVVERNIAVPVISNDTAPLLHDGEPMPYHIVKVTGGNVRNNHIYLPLDFFPADAVGGSNKSELASRSLSLTFSPGKTVETDIDGTKRIFRNRGAVADFFAQASVKDGDSLRLCRATPYSYQISKVIGA